MLIHTSLPPSEGTITDYHGNGWYDVTDDDGNTIKHRLTDWIEL